MASVGERVHVASRKLGQPAREGVVTGLSGRLVRVRWSTGEESTIVPGTGSVSIGGKPKFSLGGNSRSAKKTATVRKVPTSKARASGKSSRPAAASASKSAVAARGAKTTKTPASAAKAAARKSPPKKVAAAKTAKKTPAKKAPAKKAAAKKAPAKRVPAKRTRS